MSRLTDTKRAYDKIADLLNQEIRKRTGSTHDLEQSREALNVAFYLLGWAQFEYLVRKEAEDRIGDHARSHAVDGHAWRYVKENIKSMSVRNRLDIIFHGNEPVRASLSKDYSVRNEAAHNYRQLPREAADVSGWLETLERLVNRF